MSADNLLVERDDRIVARSSGSPRSLNAHPLDDWRGVAPPLPQGAGAPHTSRADAGGPWSCVQRCVPSKAGPVFDVGGTLGTIAVATIDRVAAGGRVRHCAGTGHGASSMV
jgi:hypothetical protein